MEIADRLLRWYRQDSGVGGGAAAIKTALKLVLNPFNIILRIILKLFIAFLIRAQEL
jgi:hypothetical protein